MSAIPAVISPGAGIARAVESQPAGLAAAYSTIARAAWTLLAVAVGVAGAGMWNSKAVDGFGRYLVAGTTIGDSGTLAGSFASNGFSFGFIFAAIAGLAASFTACNCVVFAMLPGLACSTDRAESKRNAAKALLVFAAGVVGVGALYGAYIGTLGGDKAAAAFNADRLPQAQLIFIVLGGVLLLWGAVEFGYLRAVTQLFLESWREYFASPRGRAAVMGIMVGFFAVGRPFPVFRDLLTYAATARNPLYGAAIMAIQGVGQITVMALLFILLVTVFRSRLTQWVTNRPYQPALVSAMALFAGGAYFVYYWGLSFWLPIGHWGFVVGLYH